MENNKENYKVGLVNYILNTILSVEIEDDNSAIDKFFNLEDYVFNEITLVSDKNRQHFYNDVIDQLLDLAKLYNEESKEAKDKEERSEFFRVESDIMKVVSFLYKRGKNYALKLNANIKAKINSLPNTMLRLGDNDLYRDFVTSVKNDKNKESESCNDCFKISNTLPTIKEISDILIRYNIIDVQTANNIGEGELRQIIRKADFGKILNNRNKGKLGLLIYWFGHNYFWGDRKQYCEKGADSIGTTSGKLTSTRSKYKDFINKLEQLSGSRLDGGSLKK